MEQMLLGECNVMVIGGQGMGRVADKVSDNLKYTVKVLVPRCISSGIFVDAKCLSEEAISVSLDSPKMADKVVRAGDIVMKLSPPYNVAFVDEESAGSLVPSFCAIIRIEQENILYKKYLYAFLNSDSFATQLSNAAFSSAMHVVSVGKIKAVTIPVPDFEQQMEIGDRYYDSRRKVDIMFQIASLEAKRNNIVFYNME